MNTATAVSSVRLPPKRSPSQPEAGTNTARLTRYEIETLSTDAVGTRNARPIVGSATFTMVVSMVLRKIAAT